MSFFDKYEQVFGKKEEAPAQVNTDELRKIIREEIDAAFAGFEATTDTKPKEEKKETPDEDPEETPEEPEKEEEVE